VTEGGRNALVTLANGDMRKVLNILQVTYYYTNIYTLLMYVKSIMYLCYEVKVEVY